MEPDQEAFLPNSANSKPFQPLATGFKQCNVIVASLALLQFISSYFWNRYMENYHLLLENPMQTAQTFQLETMRSAAFW